MTHIIKALILRPSIFFSCQNHMSIPVSFPVFLFPSLLAMPLYPLFSLTGAIRITRLYGTQCQVF